MCSVQIFKFLAKIYIINLIFSQEYIFIAFSQESAFSFSQVSNTHLAKIYTTRIRVPVLYIKQNVPIMAIGGSKDFGFYQPGPELRPEKVVTVTLGHPVYLTTRRA